MASARRDRAAPAMPPVGDLSNPDEWVKVDSPEDQLLQYQELLQLKIKPQFEALAAEIEKVDEQRSQWAALRDQLRQMKTRAKEESKATLDTYVNLGNDVFVEAHVPDTSRVFVAVGLGFHAEMTRDEAISFASEQDLASQTKLEALRVKQAEVATHVNAVAGAIEQLSLLASP